MSYYANQDDTNNSCRGSLNLGFATLHLDSSEKLKFEIIGKNDIRWHLKANHPIETNRWVWTLQNAITIAKDNLKKRHPERKQSLEEHQEKNFVINYIFLGVRSIKELVVRSRSIQQVVLKTKTQHQGQAPFRLFQEIPSVTQKLNLLLAAYLQT